MAPLARRTSALALALLLCWTAGHAQDSAPPAGADADAGSTLVLSGAIDAAMLDRFNAALAAGNVATVRISSHTGQTREALRIAEAVLARNLDVVVRGVCVGPCAQYILVAARNRHIEDGSLVGFNVSVSSLAHMNEVLGEDAPADFRNLLPGMKDAVDAERRLYRERGIATSLLVDPLSAMQPRCVIFHRGPDQSISGLNLSGMRYVLWVPTRKQLESAGVKITGFWPKSRRQMLDASRKLVSSGSDRFRYGDEDHLRRNRRERYSLKALKQCALEEVVEDAAPVGLPLAEPALSESGGEAVPAAPPAPESREK